MTAARHAGLVHLTIIDGIATITLDSPANRNALSAVVREELGFHLDTAIADPAVRVVVLTHTGPVFCSGMDLKESGTASESQQGVGDLPAILNLIVHSPKPIVARVAGPARAGGIGLVAACDLVVAAHEATFAFSEVRIGVVPAVISLVVTPRVHPPAARRLMLTGEVFDAGHAAAIGLVDVTVDPVDLDAEVDRLVGELLLGAPEALSATKMLLRRPPGPVTADDYALMQQLSARFFASNDGREGMAARAEKRAPSWVPTPSRGAAG